MNTDLKYLLALRFVNGIGDVTARRLLSAFPDPARIFTDSRGAFLSVEGTNERLFRLLREEVNWNAVEAEIAFLERNDIRAVSVLDANYPPLLSSCYDAPFLFFFRGTLDPVPERIISIVGTRSATEYGKQACRDLIEGLSAFSPVIVSGLAYGIDIAAHQAALDNNLETYAVVAHGLHTLYPPSHRPQAEKIFQKSCLITEFTSGDGLSPENFPKRNRIIAGISQATIVVEASDKGGALITARIAGSYGRDVFAFPGRINDPYSAGCNRLIKYNDAVLIESAEDIVRSLGWDRKTVARPAVQRRLFPEMNADELQVFKMLETKGHAPIDELATMLNFSPSKISSLLLTLEMKCVITSLPGKIFQLKS